MDFVDEACVGKDFSNLSKLTLIIPTYNRNYYLSRCFWYHAHFPFGQIIVADSSSDEKKVMNRKTVDKITQSLFDVNISYPKTNPENKVFSILWAARLVPIKGLKYMIKAFEKFHEKHPDSELKILGEGIYYNDLVKYVRDTNQVESIHILGKIDFKNLPQAYADADVFCMTSSYEAGPKTIFEAMACGCPVISNDLDHLKDIVPNGGYLVSVKDTDKFVNLLDYCYMNREILSELGVAGNHYISSHHTWERLVLGNLHISEEIRCNKNRLE